jgi:hypothetical protein
VAVIVEQTEYQRAIERLNEKLFDPERWPRRPYCTDDLESGLKIRSLKAAISKRYIQANPPWLRVWLLFDLDYPGGGMKWDDEGLDPPNWAAINGENAHAHLAYGLRTPVLVEGLNARDAPMRYLAAVESCMRERLEADPGFTGLITKNPAHPTWKVLRGTLHLYELRELAEKLGGVEKYKPKGRAPEQIGLGRNVSLFDRLRLWSYKTVLKYKAEGGLAGWNAWISSANNRALEFNGEFHYPLDSREVWWIAKSVSKWTWRNFSEAGRSEWASRKGRAGGKASGVVRAKANEDKRASARLMRASGLTLEAIAIELEVSNRTVIRWLSDL